MLPRFTTNCADGGCLFDVEQGCNVFVRHSAFRIQLTHIYHRFVCKFGEMITLSAAPLVSIIGAWKNLNVFPSVAINSIADVALCNSKSRGQLTLGELSGFVKPPESKNRPFGKLGLRKLRTFKVSPSSLAAHVVRVVLVGAKKQVARVHTRAIVAMMADQKSIWDCSVCDLPSNSVSNPMDSRDSQSKAAVSIIKAVSNPLPALVWFSNLYALPKLLFNLIGEHLSMLTKAPRVSILFGSARFPAQLV